MTDLFVTDGAFWLTLLGCGLAFGRPGAGPSRYALPLCLAMALLTLLLPVRSVTSFGVSLLLLGLVYLFRPYRSALPLLAVPLLSPFARYLDSVMGIEIRLYLSRAAGKAFDVMGREAVVRGTEITLDGRAFGVDAACAGLHMLMVGLATAVLLMAVVEWRVRKTFALWLGGGVLVGTVVLVALSNLARIVVLVDRGWGAETPWHSWTGLVCFAVYVLLPLAMGTSWLSGQSWAVRAADVESDGLSPAASYRRIPAFRLSRSLVIRAAIVLGAGGLFAFAKTRPAPVPAAVASMSLLYGQAPALRAHDVLAYQFADALVYRKPIPAFYNAEHSPLICWRGSGYEIADIRRDRLLNGKEVFRGTLRREGHQLQTAWWMSNGEQTTLDQWVWRSEMASGAPPFALVNVTSVGEAELMCWVKELLTKNDVGVDEL